jgi:hypothetical protein
MSERLPDDEDPYMRLEMGDGEFFDASPANTSAYLYTAKYLEFSHIELDLGETEEGARRVMCFFPDHEQYEAMAAFIARYGFPILVNLQHVDDYVIDAYIEWHDRNGAEESAPPRIMPEPLLLPPPEEGRGEATELSGKEMEGLTAVKAKYEAEQTVLANLPMDERSVCLRALAAAREEWLPYHIEDMRADRRSMKHRLGAAELLQPIDILLDQLYKIDHPEEAQQ